VVVKIKKYLHYHTPSSNLVVFKFHKNFSPIFTITPEKLPSIAKTPFPPVYRGGEVKCLRLGTFVISALQKLKSGTGKVSPCVVENP